MNEFIFVDIYVAKALVQVVQVFSIHTLLLTSNSRNNHIHKVHACTRRKNAHSNLVDILLGFAFVSSTTIALRLGKESKVTKPIICPLMFLALFHLFWCSAIGTFAIFRMAQLFLTIGYAFGFGGGGWSYKTILKIFDMLKS